MSKNRPDWLKKRIKLTGGINDTETLLKLAELNTVCQSAICPNMCECFSRGVATFLIMGNICTRNCSFCAVENGQPLPPDNTEPDRLAETVKKLGLQHVVITSVTRDDLKDGGAAHFANCIKSIKNLVSDITVEVLTPDFLGSKESVFTVINAGPEVFNHNLETVPSLYAEVRPMASYKISLEILQHAKSLSPATMTKSGIMLGLGESFIEVRNVLEDLKDISCDMITIGQYLQPTEHHIGIKEYITPETFEEYKTLAYEIGFSHVESAPFVRSSFNAYESYAHSTLNNIK